MMTMVNIKDISQSRKVELAERYGKNGTITADSWAIAAIDDIKGLWRIYDADMWYLYTHIGEKPATSTTPTPPTTGGGGGGSTETPVGTPVATVVWTGNVSVPSTITPGKSYWFGMELKNTGNADWVGYLGVKIITNDQEVFVYQGDKQYAQQVKAGETKMIWCKATIPDDVVINETTRVSLLRTQV